MSCAVAARSALTASVVCGVRVRRRERRDLQQLVDRRRLVLLLGEAVALRERRHLVRVDAIDQAIEVLAQSARRCARRTATRAGRRRRDRTRSGRGRDGRASARARRRRNGAATSAMSVAIGSTAAGARRLAARRLRGRGRRQRTAACGFGFEPHAAVARQSPTAARAGSHARVVMLGAPARTFGPTHESRVVQAGYPVEVAPGGSPPASRSASRLATCLTARRSDVRCSRPGDGALECWGSRVPLPDGRVNRNANRLNNSTGQRHVRLNPRLQSDGSTVTRVSAD